MKRIYYLISFISFTISCNGQVLPTKDPYFVTTTDTVSVLGPKSITRNILQDKNGIMWFASWEGILSYDGKNFTNHTLKNQLIQFHVFSIAETNSGDLWFGTIGGGAYKYDGKTFTLYTTNDGLASNTVMCIMEDTKGNIWFGTDFGLSCYGGKSFLNYTTNDGLESNHVYAMIQDKNGKFWFGTQEGISCLDPTSVLWTNKGTFTPFKNTNGSTFYNVRSLVEDNSGKIWIGCQDGLFEYDGKTTTTHTTNFTGYVYADKSDNIWISEGGPGAMSLSKHTDTSFKKIFTNNDQVFGCTEDKDGNIWFGTAVGIFCYDGKTFNDFKLQK